MEAREKNEHPLSLKVMRLTRPSLFSSMVVTCEQGDVPGNLFTNDLKKDLTAVTGSETLAVGQFLLLPQSFGNLYLGETFSSYVCVQNNSSVTVKDVAVKSDLQTSSQKVSLSAIRAPQELQPRHTVDEVIHHEVTELGTHILVCEVSYTSTAGLAKSFRKFFKIQVLNPLNVKTNFYNAESDDVYLEAQVQNMTAGPICLEKVQLESSTAFTVRSLNQVNGRSVFGSVNVVQPQACRQFLYCLSPKPSLASATNIGKLDIVWRSNLGERGRLQTSQLQRMIPEYRDVRITVIELPNMVYIEEPFTFTCKLFNTSGRKMELTLNLHTTTPCNLVWADISGKLLGTLEAAASKELTLTAVPLATGLHNISGIQLKDSLNKKTYDYDELAQVFVVQKPVAQ
ncbi:trafficking protein particle complex subunit 13 [Cloeon dipterum]|uniref:trafficking protein particle complex subunit 13 n=1 Tax=Cloeon dipterum TaxID=197152 RepID=UPI0032208501